MYGGGRTDCDHGFYCLLHRPRRERSRDRKKKSRNKGDNDDDDDVVVAAAKCSKTENVSLQTLPGELFLEILARLPVKSLIRFKPVSKHWYSVISSNELARRQLELSSSLFPQFILFCQDGMRRCLNLLHYDECSSEVKDLVHLPVYNGRDFFVVGSVNGLVCLFLQNHQAFAIWNPATEKFQRVPRIVELMHCDHEVELNGFGYETSTDDYKIFVSFVNESENYGARFYYVFSVRPGTWKRLYDLDGSYFSGMSCGEAFCIDNSLYWPPKAHGYRSGVGGILKFNLLDYTTEVIPGIDWETLYFGITDIWKMKGCLSLCGLNKEDRTCDIWTLKQSSQALNYWEKIWSIDISDMSVVGFTDTGKYLVQQSSQVKLLELSKNGADRFKRGTDYHDLVWKSWCYVESLTDFQIGNDEGLAAALSANTGGSQLNIPSL